MPINYPELKTKYKTETIILIPKGFEINGVATRFIPIFKNKYFEEIIVKNGGEVAINFYRLYQKKLRKFWIVTPIGMGLGLVSFLLGNTTILGAICFIISMFFTIYSIIVSKKLQQYLVYTVWHFNKNILFGSLAFNA